VIKGINKNKMRLLPQKIGKEILKKKYTIYKPIKNHKIFPTKNAQIKVSITIENVILI